MYQPKMFVVAMVRRAGIFRTRISRAARLWNISFLHDLRTELPGQLEWTEMLRSRPGFWMPCAVSIHSSLKRAGYRSPRAERESGFNRKLDIRQIGWFIAKRQTPQWKPATVHPEDRATDRAGCRRRNRSVFGKRRRRFPSQASSADADGM